MIISDDIGSFPIPEQESREELYDIAIKIVTKNVSFDENSRFNRIVADIMKRKIYSGIKRPTYPQIQDMISQFFYFIERLSDDENPLVVRDEFAIIPELNSIDEVAREYYKKNNRALELRVCVTGPLELYLKRIGTLIHSDLLFNIAKSVSKFVSNSILDRDYIKTRVVSLDEPSLGLNTNLIFERDDLIEALDIAVKPAKKLDVQIHLHSLIESDIILQTENISIIGVESAENPSALNEISRKELEIYDKFLRVGISRTNILSLASDYLDKTGIDVWKEGNFDEMLNKMENIKIIGKRLNKAYSIFGNNIKYAGPDCGLGAWPSQNIAFKNLKNTASAIDRFNSNLRTQFKRL